jgi:hypothetical protein
MKTTSRETIQALAAAAADNPRRRANLNLRSPDRRLVRDRPARRPPSGRLIS